MFWVLFRFGYIIQNLINNNATAQTQQSKQPQNIKKTENLTATSFLQNYNTNTDTDSKTFVSSLPILNIKNYNNKRTLPDNQNSDIQTKKRKLSYSQDQEINLNKNNSNNNSNPQKIQQMHALIQMSKEEEKQRLLRTSASSNTRHANIELDENPSINNIPDTYNKFNDNNNSNSFGLFDSDDDLLKNNSTVYNVL